MKYVVSWQNRATGPRRSCRSPEACNCCSKWSPSEGTTFHQFLGRVDGRGGYAVVETDDPALWWPRTWRCSVRSST